MSHGLRVPSRRRAHATSACALLVAAVAACGPPPAPPALPLNDDDFTLTGVPVDVDSAEIRLSFGDPDSVISSPSPFGGATEMQTWVYDGFEIRFAGSGEPVGTMIRAPGERTARGIAVGDAARLVLLRYGDPDARIDASWTYIRENRPGDLSVVDFLVREDTVRRIYVGRAVP